MAEVTDTPTTAVAMAADTAMKVGVTRGGVMGVTATRVTATADGVMTEAATGAGIIDVRPENINFQTPESGRNGEIGGRAQCPPSNFPLKRRLQNTRADTQGRNWIVCNIQATETYR